MMKSTCFILLLSFAKAEFIINGFINLSTIVEVKNINFQVEDFSTDFSNEITGLSDIGINNASIKVFKCGSTRIILSCGKIEKASSYVLRGGRWNTSHLTYKILNTPSKHLQMNLVAREIRKAFALWSKASSLTFKPAEKTAHINIAFKEKHHEDDYPFDGPRGVLAHGFFPIYGGAIHFDKSEKWSIQKRCKNCIDLFQVATHEIGHVLGLHHSTHMKAVMYALYHYRRRFHLHRDDIKGIRALYGK